MKCGGALAVATTQLSVIERYRQSRERSAGLAPNGETIGQDCFKVWWARPSSRIQFPTSRKYVH